MIVKLEIRTVIVKIEVRYVREALQYKRNSLNRIEKLSMYFFLNIQRTNP